MNEQLNFDILSDDAKSNHSSLPSILSWVASPLSGPFYLPNIAGTALSEPIIDTLNNMIKKSKTLNQKIIS